MQKSMSPEEAQAVVKLQLERGVDPSEVSLDEIAEALNVPRSQVENLLNEVRQSQAMAHARAMADHRRRDMRRLAAAFVFAVLVVGGGFGFYKYRQWQYSQGYGPIVEDNGGGRITVNPAAAERMANDMAGDAVIDAAITEDVRAALGSEPDFPPMPPEEMVPPTGPLPQFRIGSGEGSKMIQASGKSLEQVSRETEKWFAGQRKPVAREANADMKTQDALERRDLKDPGLARIPAVIHPENGEPARAIYLPLYTGADPDIEAMAAKERLRLLGDAMGVPIE
ncbi:hypothetical protein EON79_03010 [bacterium]|nr:MAG: hypothetical protein EON79_03010 [bacterium]